MIGLPEEILFANNSMTTWQAIILGIVQGLTEFIPISSTAHLVFTARALGLYHGVDKTLQAEQTTATMAVIQLGTLLAVLSYFASDILSITVAFVRDHMAWFRGRTVSTNQNFGRLSREAWLGWLVIIGSVPVSVVGLLFKEQIEGSFTKNLWVIATMMIIVAVMLAMAEALGKRNRTMAELGFRDAIAVGLAQVLALIPGSSRSGSTIMGGLFVGETRETAARFSFLLSIPAIAASGLLELNEAITKLPSGSYGALFVATIVSGVVGYASIWFLLRFLRTNSTAIFIAYRVVVGGLILLLLYTGYIGSGQSNY
jgi:undecaprenyl-diphosphatase